MFGKRKEDRRHRSAEEGADELLDGDAPQEPPHDPELTAALLELGLNRDAPLREPEPEPAVLSDAAAPSEPEKPAQEKTAQDRPIDRDLEKADEVRLPAWAGVPTAAMLAEPEDIDPRSIPPKDSALQKAKDQVASVQAELTQAGSGSPPEMPAPDLERAGSKPSMGSSDELRAAVQRAEAAEKSARELQSTVAGLKADLERARSEAVAAGVALERVEREAKTQGGTAVPSDAQADAARADSLRLASDLSTNLQRQEAMIAALAGLQAEVTEQRAWFEAQIANMGETESQQAGVIAALEAAIRDRDVELVALRQQLLEAEAKRAEEAAAFVAALERQ